MSKKKITVDGLFLLERVVRSCVPTPNNGGMASRDYLIELVKKGQEISYESFLKGFPSQICPVGLYNVYDHLGSFASEKEVNEIDGEFVLNFFAGNQHIERAEYDVREEKIAEIIGKRYALKDFVSHVLLPVIVTEKSKEFFCAKYVNGHLSFPLKNLVAFPEESYRIKVGDIVLVHYASIISSNIDYDMAQLIFAIQYENKEFMKACMAISNDGIDHQKMLHFAWAKNLIKVCNV